MNYLISFLEGIITFISPCLLPMLPIYISYFSGQNNSNNKREVLINALGFVLGFTFIFVLLGAFAGTIGNFLKEYKTVVNLITGLIVILFGLNFLEVIKIPLISRYGQLRMNSKKVGFAPSILFGIVFSIAWTPCVGAFLGSALMLAASTGETFQGVLMLLSFSLGLGIPFIASAVLIDQLKSTFDFINNHYKIVKLLSGSLLIIVGIFMATGLMGYFLSLLTF